MQENRDFTFRISKKFFNVPIPSNHLILRPKFFLCGFGNFNIQSSVIELQVKNFLKTFLKFQNYSIYPNLNNNVLVYLGSGG